MHKAWWIPIVAGLLFAGCVTVPTGPSVMVLPGSSKDFSQFQVDDALCRQWASQQTGTTTNKASTDAAVSSAAVGTLIGAASGAAIGAAAGDPAGGAAVGAGVGLVGGTAAGANRAAASEWSIQQRYDIAYMQCMYSKGNQIPMPAGVHYPRARSIPPPRSHDVPPPPPGEPPPPPPQ
jgi:hypothetical protein